MKRVRVTKDSLRKRPEIVRYMYLAVGEKKLHCGLTHTGLLWAINADKITTLYVSDFHTRKVLVVDPIAFLEWWADNYTDPTATYREDL